ncbi:MAG: hypothetical protein ACOZNI_26595 [Myxococcota bacterium]
MNIEAVLDDVAAEIEWLSPPPVFIGGATIGLYLDPFGRAQVRPTRDVDCIVPRLRTTADWFALESELRRRGWRADATGPICRYVSPRGHLVDFLAAEPSVQGFAGTWFARAVAGARPHRLPSGREILVPLPADLLACKLEAFFDRGITDPLGSPDLEDIVALLDGCAELTDVDAWARGKLAEIRSSPSLSSAAEAHLPRGGDETARLRHFRERLARLS